MLVRELSRQTRLTSAYDLSFLGVPPDQPVPVSPTVEEAEVQTVLWEDWGRGDHWYVV